MRIYLQWAQAQPADFQALDVRASKDIRNLPRRPVPTGAAAVDNMPGWICGLNCQGIVFEGYDHIAVVPEGDSLRITGWNDDPEDWPDGTRWATEWLLSPPAPDPAIGGQMNTVQQRTVWAKGQAVEWFPGPTLPWEEFVSPPANMTFHGIWLPEPLFLEHVARRSAHGWREWLS